MNIKVNFNLLPWREVKTRKIQKIKIVGALIAFLMTLFFGVLASGLFNQQVLLWKNKYQFLLAKTKALSIDKNHQANSLIFLVLREIESIPQKLFLQKILYAPKNIVIFGTAENYSALSSWITVLHQKIRFGKVKLLAAEKQQGKMHFKLAIIR